MIAADDDPQLGGRRILARVNNVGVLTELAGAILLVILLWAFAVRSPRRVLLAVTGRDAADALPARSSPRRR